MAKQRNEGRRERKAAQQAANERKKRRGSVVRLGVGTAAVIGVVAFAYSSYTTRELLKSVKTAAYPAGRHLAGPISYTENPPLGGPHNVVWQNCGVYEVPIHNEHAVHSLEHGAIWITYRPDLPQGQIQRLRDLAADEFMLLSPYPGLPGPVVASAWNNQITLQSASDPALPAFISKYKNNPQTTPEFGAPCAGGTSAVGTADTLNRTPGPMAR